MSVLRAVACLLLAAPLIGCTVLENTTITPRPSGAPPPSETVRSLVLPFDAYEMTENELHATANARDSLTRVCMNDRGHEWPVVRRPTDAPRAAHRRRYGIVEDAVAGRYGYRVPEALFDPHGVQAAQRSRDEGLAPAQQEAVHGSGGKGCERTAFDRLNPGPRPDFDDFNRLKGDIFAVFQRSPEARAYTTAWSECMKRKGHDYRDPFAAVRDRRWSSGLSAASPARGEVRTARDDVACKETTGLVDGWRRAEAALQNRAVEEHSDYFRALGRAKEEQLARVAAVNAKP
ncbi:hypothetical protein ACFQ7A_06980 [Streptomyces sp. NPDC056528]|uniref:hypothetical protein n=1 Tax=Streptomyces sp. NPDC056528 TaxID=3345854 RepID=UPI003677136E